MLKAKFEPENSKCLFYLKWLKTHRNLNDIVVELRIRNYEQTEHRMQAVSSARKGQSNSLKHTKHEKFEAPMGAINAL